MAFAGWSLRRGQTNYPSTDGTFQLDEEIEQRLKHSLHDLVAAINQAQPQSKALTRRCTFIRTYAYRSICPKSKSKSRR